MFEEVNIKKLVHVLEIKMFLQIKLKYCEFKQNFPINCLSWKIFIQSSWFYKNTKFNSLILSHGTGNYYITVYYYGEDKQ